MRVIAGERVLLLEQQLARRTQDNVELSECLTESFQLAAQVCVGLYVDVYMGVFIHYTLCVCTKKSNKTILSVTEPFSSRGFISWRPS